MVAVGASPDGLNINAGVGATHTEHLGEWCREHGCDVAVSLDGDADRLIMADATGRVYNGDTSLRHGPRAPRARSRRGRDRHPHDELRAGKKRLGELGIPFGRAKVGDRYVVEMLKEKGWLLGGETSGHLLALDRQTTGDRIVSALQVLAAMKAAGKSLAELTADLELLPAGSRQRPAREGHRLARERSVRGGGEGGGSRTRWDRPHFGASVRHRTPASHHG